MPYTPFARFLAIALVVLCGVGLLWPDDRALQWMFYALGAVPVLLGIFTVSAVRSAPPFDDRSFHRGLPPGDGHAFFRVVWIHLLVLAGIALLVVTYCLLMNFGWHAMTWGILMFTLPVWALCSAFGLTASNAISGQQWKSLSWIAIFATPAFSWALMHWIRQGIDPEDPWPRFRVLPLHTIVLAGSLLYPLCWWLSAVARRRGLSLAFGAATGMLMPWLAIYGGYGTAPEVDLKPRTGTGEVVVMRKPVPSTAKGLLPIDSVVEISGLKEGANMSFLPEKRRDRDDEDRAFVPATYVSAETASDGPAARWMDFNATMKDGKVVWGMEPVLQNMRALLPPHETFESCTRWWPGPKGELSIQVPETDEIPAPPPGRRRPAADHRPMTRREFFNEEWQAWVSGGGKWKLLASCPVQDGCSVNLPGGGKLKVVALVPGVDGGREIKIKEYQESLWQTGGVWDSLRSNDSVSLMVFFIDESGKHAYAARYANGTQTKVMLGMVSESRYDAGSAESKGFRERSELLERSTVYVLMRDETEGPWTKQILPVPKEIEDR